MIEFSGELSDKSRLYLQKKLYRGSCLAVLIATVAISIPIIFLGVFWEAIALLFLILPFIMGIVLIIPKLNPQTKTLKLNTPKKITIAEGTVERDGEGQQNYASREIAAVKKVIDMGEWYHIIFYFGHKDIFFICQKDLITIGTIEAFEKLFDGKIVLGKK